MSDVVRFEDSVFTVRGKLLDGIHCIDEVLISYRRPQVIFQVIIIHPKSLSNILFVVNWCL